MVHATTQSSNAVLTFTGAKTAVLTTRGFGDTLMIMRATGRVAGLSVFERHHYRMTQKPRLLVDERDIFEIAERVDYQGRVVTPLDEASVREAAARIREGGYQAVAVAFLFSHKNPAHERRVEEILRQSLPGLYVCISSEVASVMGEYERSATALFNAYVGPVIESYIRRLEGTLVDAGLKRKLLIVQANGGVATAAQTVPIFTIESGPAAGVVGAAHIAKTLGVPNVIATDVGGTTFKVAIVENGQWSYSKETVLNQYQLRLPMVDLASIGAGGGSIAWADGDRLRIGPKSAAAHPGPACYGLGGEEPTVTDADVVLGYIAPDRFLGGRMRLHPDRAMEAIRRRIADPLFGGDVLAAAAGIRQVIDSQMADLIRKSTLERGRDPRDFVMMAYGGAGPVHAASYGGKVGVREIIIPFFATVHSAYGAALSDIRFSLQYSDPLVLPVAPERLERIYADMEARGHRQLQEADVPPERRRFYRWIEARYRRQVHHVRVAAPSRVDEAGIQQLAGSFEAEYERLFGKGAALRDAGIELVNYGVEAVGVASRVAEERTAPGERIEPRTSRNTYCPSRDAMVSTPVYDGLRLLPGTQLVGPIIIEHPGTTIVVLSGQTARIDDFRHTHVVTKRPALDIEAMDDQNVHQNSASEPARPGSRQITMNDRIDFRVDPVKFEVLNHRLLSITEEMGIQYMRCSGSNVLITGNDAATAIMMPDGALVAVGPYIVTQGNVLPLIVDSTKRLCADSVGINDGDIFICNDPYLGAIHAPDFATVAPIFYDKELVGWIGASGHQLDTGGMDPGGFSIKAVDVHQEGLRMPPVKLVEAGRVREDVLGWILNQVRDPLVGLDVKGQIAALNTGRRSILELIDTWGIETVKAVMAGSITYAREKLERRLRELPDGTWREIQYIDHDGHEPRIYKIVCTMRKSGDRLVFDFSGTSPNARGLINSTYSGLQAAVLSSVYINLCWDIPWNRGVRDCIDIISEVGTVNNCAYPAPCAMATISAVIVTIDASWRCLSQLLLASEKYRDQAMAVWSGTSMAPIFAGTSQHGFPFAATEMSHFGGGGGARTYGDGVDTAGIVFNTTPNMPNIEDQEAEYPVLYLFRRHLRDSGGPGRYRGGRSGELAYTMYDAPGDRLDGLFAGTGAEMPNAIGLGGGLPGAAIRVARVVGTDLQGRLSRGQPMPASLEEIQGNVEILSCKHVRTPMGLGDVWYHSWQAGGGYGDPLTRDPNRVAEDVARGVISSAAGKDIYGVMLGESGTLDSSATERRREELRRERLASAKRRPAPAGEIRFSGHGCHRYGDVLTLDFEQDSVACGYCGHIHCRPGDNLLEHLSELETPLWAAGPVRGEDYDRGRFQLRHLCCTNCGGLVDVRVALEGTPPPVMRVEYALGSD